MSETDPRHADYNGFVQRVQTECARWGVESRIAYEDRADGRPQAAREEWPERARLEVYWDGAWHELGSEVPFTSGGQRDCRTNEMEWAKLQARMASELSKS